jgi:hypothetical protein
MDRAERRRALELEPRIVARASRSQNRAGNGGCGPGGVKQFFPLPWCPVHRGVELERPGIAAKCRRFL